MNENNDELLQTIMGLIMNGGDAKSCSMEALQAAKLNNFEEAAQKLKKAEEALSRAHKSQTALLTREANGDNIELSLLLIHGQDHLMNAITFRDLAEEMIDLHKKIK